MSLNSSQESQSLPNQLLPNSDSMTNNKKDFSETVVETTKAVAAESPNTEPTKKKTPVAQLSAAADPLALPADTSQHRFSIDLVKLQHVFDPKNKKALDELGGVQQILKDLQVDPQTGLSSDEDKELSWTNVSGHVHEPHVSVFIF